MLLIAAVALCSVEADAKTFLHAKGTMIVDGADQPVILRGVGLGGWMVQEGYMLRLQQLGTQKHIRAKLEELVGQTTTDDFYRAWLDNAVTKADVERMAALGFNSVRVPLHYALLIDEAGHSRREGFSRLDKLVHWARANHLYVILDLHAAPGGQGTDLSISDRDPSQPSLWESASNLRLATRLWSLIARRYRNEPTIGGYDLLNEPKWDFSNPGDGHGCREQINAPLKRFLADAIDAIRQVDDHHMIVVEGNCWGNNYAGLLPIADRNIALSFHKYWTVNDQSAIVGMIGLRDQYQRPLWLGETGENSDEWYRAAIKLVESNGIGWALWPWKKMGTSSPLEIIPGPGWPRLAAWMNGTGPSPPIDEARAALMQLALHDVRIENTPEQDGVIEAVIPLPRPPRP